jgi:hypothetical protein
MWKEVHLRTEIWNESTSRYSDWRRCCVNLGITKELRSVNSTCNSCGRTSVHTSCSCLWPSQLLVILFVFYVLT